MSANTGKIRVRRVCCNSECFLAWEQESERLSKSARSVNHQSKFVLVKNKITKKSSEEKSNYFKACFCCCCKIQHQFYWPFNALYIIWFFYANSFIIFIDFQLIIKMPSAGHTTTMWSLSCVGLFLNDDPIHGCPSPFFKLELID